MMRLKKNNIIRSVVKNVIFDTYKSKIQVSFDYIRVT